MSKQLSLEQEIQIDDLVYETIINAVIEDCEIKQGGKKYKLAIKYLISKLEEELIDDSVEEIDYSKIGSLGRRKNEIR